MIKILSALFLLPLILTSGVGKNADSFLIQPYKEEVNTSKTIFVDLSNNEKFLEDDADPYITYHMDTNYTVSLVLDKHNIYKTESPIPSEIFTKESYGFEILSHGGSYKTSYYKGGVTQLDRPYYDYLSISSYESGKDASINGYGIYKERTLDPDATYKTQRIWLSDNVVTDVQYELAVGYVYNNDYVITTMTSITNSKNAMFYYYVDVPYELRDINFLRMSKFTNHNYQIYQNTYIPSLSFGVCYFTGDKYEDFSNIYTDIVIGADYIILGLVVEAYLTYGKDISNGCTFSTVSNLDSTWFKEKSATTDELKQNTIMDYTGYSKNGNSYEGLVKDARFSINEKWNTMKSQAGLHGGTNWFEGLFGSNAFLFGLIGILSLVVVSGVVVLMVIQKKKRIKDSRSLY